ncbi:UDP-N-acetylglucosamine 1-carboxyvinyltransferase [Catellatospora chokoriensis]|uniref:UDP-N-acetylglucosamine 1-carboxyvinyltransferase n=1 Tax=Catellatospora chokoriensis TaxID=310353 RepID=A0A8J3KCE0_9ACTN|nr:UDP-N-acetylglucosamine 1-carboxyvinyltransferase [Catellatospora chokoriensis]GIF94620.1 UDP-N-acetylglucosamine 1-carboxyvinyltransferase 1 [Catellatospora chokoriensis]
MPPIRYRVQANGPLRGTAVIQGAKNAALPMIGAALLASSGQTVLRNVPTITDVANAVELARAVGAHVEHHPADRLLIIDASTVTSPLLPGDLTRRFRGSVLFLSSLLYRCGEVIYEGAGGCNLGTRGLDWHYRGLVRLGARIEEKAGTIHITLGATAAADLYLDTPSHTGTENLMIAAATTPGRTVIENAALEPEVVDVARFLTAMGAHIDGAGTGRITVEGVDQLHATDYTVMPDRIDAGVLCMAAGITGGTVQLVGGDVLDAFGVARHKLEQMGVTLRPEGAVTTASRLGDLHPINIITDTHPGFATDLQPPLMALATQASGTSYIRERIHDARYALASELTKLGASIVIEGERATVIGATELRGDTVTAHDLRTGVSLILAGLVAHGETVIENGRMIERGHADLVARLRALGAHISREELPDTTRP